MNLLITGATGFIGSRLMKQALRKQYNVIAIARAEKLAECQLLDVNINNHDALNWHAGELIADYDWSASLQGIGCVIHCAARVHQMQDNAAFSQSMYDETNFHATVNLARQAAQAGVKRFIFLSSIKVNGEQTEQGQPFQPTVTTPPSDPYGVSKYKAEQALQTLAQETAMEVVIIRPPLVYGPGVKANFQSMMKWASRTVPLPLGAIKNQRSMVFIDNLVDLIITCIHHPKAANQVFLASDGQDVSTSQLLREVKQAAQSHCLLLPIPMSWFTIAANCIRKPDIAQRLCSSLQVDITKTQTLLGWQPPFSWAQGIAHTVKHYQQHKNG